MSIDIPPPTDVFLNACTEFGIELEPGDTDRFAEFLRILYTANQTTNLTAIRDPAEGWLKHVFDGLTLLPLLSEAQPNDERLSIGDVGSGGGIPALIIAIAMPDADVTLLEATGRKCEFLQIGRAHV